MRLEVELAENEFRLVAVHEDGRREDVEGVAMVQLSDSTPTRAYIALADDTAIRWRTGESIKDRPLPPRVKPDPEKASEPAGAVVPAGTREQRIRGCLAAAEARICEPEPEEASA